VRDDDRRDAQGGCQATNAGVNFVVAAGNEGWDFDFPSQPDLPAAYPQVLTVTAMADSDGKQGGTGPNSLRLGGR
jgi:subtilisin